MEAVYAENSVTIACRCCALLLFIVGSATAQLTGEDILENIDKAFFGIEDYTVLLDVTTELQRMKIPPMRVKMYFKRPDQVHFESTSFAVLPKEGIAFASGELRGRFNAGAISYDTLQGRVEATIPLTPRADKTGLRQVLISVNTDRWTVERIIAPSSEGHATMSISYLQHDGYWLPSSMKVVLKEDEPEPVTESPFDQFAPLRRRRIPSSGVIIIRYSDYKVNTGLRDELFDHLDP